MTKFISIEQIPSLVSGINRQAKAASVFIPGAATVPIDFIGKIQEEPDCTRDLHITTSISAGLDNPMNVELLHESAKVTGLFMLPSFAGAHKQGRYQVLPVSFYGCNKYLSSRCLFDLTVVQVTPPDKEGFCSLSIGGEFSPTALRQSKKRLAIINPNLPPLPGAVSIPVSKFDYLMEANSVPLTYQVDTDSASETISGFVAGLVEDRATLQMGVGKVPNVLASALSSHRNLRLWSGMLSDGTKTLYEADALDPGFRHTACALAGSETFYQWLPSFSELDVLGCEITHNPMALAKQKKLTSINSALEVDLFGQCNLEYLAGRPVSSVGGAPDFASAAKRSEGGLSIVALNATYKKGARSRIVSQLSAGVVSLPRHDVDCIVTEFGVADLRGKSVTERAREMVKIAAPQFQEELEQEIQSLF